MSYIKQIFKLKNSQLRILRKRFSDERIMLQRKYFKIGSGIMQPVTVWRLFYYIDEHGDFINNGERIHHHVARAIYNSMSPKKKIETLQYIEEQTGEE